MKKIATAFNSFLVLCFFSAQLFAAPVLIPAAPKLAATAYILIDADTGKVLVANNENKRIPPASLTKLMTSYISAYEIGKGNIGVDDLALVSEKAWRTPGSRMFIREGTQVKVSDLLKGIIIQSGNDASVAMAEHVAGSEGAFADLMNQHAQLLGMQNSHFINATGLPAEGHYTSAADLALLARAIIKGFPDHYGTYSEKYFTYNKIRQPNRNKLLWRDKSVDGLKTGHTDAAGYCLVTSAKRKGMRLISVVMGTRSEESRAQESQKLLAYGFRYYESLELYKAGEVLNQAKVWAGLKDNIQLGTVEPVAITIPRGQSKALSVSLDLDKTITAPVVEGARYGSINISLNGETLLDSPVVALESVEPAGLIKRIWHSIVLFFLGLIG
ncbi:D-alanyl-D-alanine carboxypeptidase family protein [Motiliproteus sp. MSK22-1]|uniref:D-alanyl-D-alanine carboxypeptidase family protein n=1 Tax=Motiliproteus sp. MSK22-1 TaxID=1897630 RepID=UPI000975B00B|nr:D-alanyl-D-alanine carboxypeptidase family protein [Motiliproteus sp. MSK22-1]OMH33726.1 serine-type D-Ala-D-Ala carboxypeptidase [Motiliproteus sp. MSK22-1]